jgi:DNA-binding NtrC family response regulator
MIETPFLARSSVLLREAYRSKVRHRRPCRYFYLENDSGSVKYGMASRRDSLRGRSSQAALDSRPTICLVTADRSFLDEILLELAPWYHVVFRQTYDDLARWLREEDVRGVVLDIDTEGEDSHGGLSVLHELRTLNKELVLLSISRSRKRSLSEQAITAGADSHFRSPVDLSELRLTLTEALEMRSAVAERERMEQAALDHSHFQDLIGSSEPMRRVYDAISQVASSRINVIVRGESGTGKELVARALVAISSRANKAYIRLNCAALPEHLIESELFGHERGAFTGAVESRPGQIELADGGTLFLDEIATLSLPLQTKLLRVLEDRQVQRLGGRNLRKIDFRLICATNEPLEEMVRAGRFREDLYYRIHVVPIYLPPLRERMGDVSILCNYFLRMHCLANGMALKRISNDALSVLEDHHWPGNVRELENLIQRLIITVRGEEILPQHFPSQVLAQSAAAQEAILLPDSGTNFDDEIKNLEIALLTTALRRSDGSKTSAARLLKLDLQRMKYLCRKYSL